MQANKDLINKKTEATAICKKRIQKEYDELKLNPLPNIKIAHDTNNLLDWYCMIYDLNEEEYKNGQYIFNIKMSPNYPFDPPEFYFLTPNGRFDIDKKLCFSNSSYHKESWSPLWTIKTIILGFLSFFLEKKSSGIGHLEASIDEKIIFAEKSQEYNKTKLKKYLDLFT
jgi:ubiquitin-conjugating enzyme E2 J2